MFALGLTLDPLRQVLYVSSPSQRVPRLRKGPVKVVSIVVFGKNEAGTGDSEVEFTCPAIICKFHSKKNVTEVMTLLQ